MQFRFILQCMESNVLFKPGSEYDFRSMFEIYSLTLSHTIPTVKNAIFSLLYHSSLSMKAPVSHYGSFPVMGMVRVTNDNYAGGDFDSPSNTI